MARNDKIVYLTSPELDREKPILLLLHGATDDPSEMLDIAEECRNQYNVLLYSYDFHKSAKKVALDLVRQMEMLEAKMKQLDAPGLPVENVTVITYSYSAIIFRETVLLAEDQTLFSKVSLIQLAPTAGGSFLARDINHPIVTNLISIVSKPSIAENPYGGFSRQIWGDDGTRKFNEAINPSRVRTLLLENDSYSAKKIKDQEIHARYENGIGTNVVVIPKSLGVTHEYFPRNPTVLAFLKKMLEPATNNVAQKSIP